MRLFRRPVKINFSKREYRELEHDVLTKRWIRGNEIFFMGLGLALILLGCLDLFGFNPLHASGTGWGAVIVGVFYSALVASKITLRVYARRLVAEDKLNDRMEIGYESLNRFIRERDVQPRLIVNGKRYYARADFGDVASLLRGSVAPRIAEEALLRSAIEPMELPPEELLHPVGVQVEEVTLSTCISSAQGPLQIIQTITNASED